MTQPMKEESSYVCSLCKDLTSYVDTANLTETSKIKLFGDFVHLFVGWLLSLFAWKWRWQSKQPPADYWE